MSEKRHRLRIALFLSVALAGVYIAAGGVIHLIEWLQVYRDVPSRVPGAFVVKQGMPLNFALSILGVGALAVAVVRFPRAVIPAAAANIAFQLTTAGALLATRYVGLLGWEESTFTAAAQQSLTVEAAAIAALAAVVVLRRRRLALIQA